MKRNKLYVLLSILTIIFLFSFAALCTQTAATDEEKTDVEEEEEEAEEEVAAEEEEEEEEAAEEEEEEEEETDGEKAAPTIELEIYQGPTYSAGDGVCYYRVQANVTGKPSPSVDFSKDDSGGSWGSRKAQINLHDPSETYTLTATAENSEGTATDSIELSWGCAEPEPEPEPEPDIVSLNVPKVTTEGGYIEQGGGINSGGGLFAGDSRAGSGFIGDRAVKGYCSFDITGLSGKTIDDATLTLNINSIYGSPGPGFGGMWIGVVEWGPEALVLSDFNLPQVGIQLFDMSGDGNITCDTATLKTQLQNAIDDGKSRFQIRISCPGAISVNNTWDGWSYLQAGVNLNVDYY